MSIRVDDLGRVRNLPLFKQCDDNTFANLIGGSFLQRFPQGTVLMTEGDPVDFLYIILDGTVELRAGWKSKASTLAVLHPVSTFVLADIVLETDATMSAITLERAEVLMIPGESFRMAMQENAKFCFAVSEELSGCYRGLVRAIKNMKLRNSTERLANYLLAQYSRQGRKTTINLPQEKRVLASLLGMTPENMSRAFAKLTKQGVRVEGSKVTFTNLAALVQLARPTQLIDNHFESTDSLTGKANTERNGAIRNSNGLRPHL